LLAHPSGRTWHPVSSFLAVRTDPGRAGDFYAAVKVARQQRGLALDENDIWVGGTALALGAIQVSRDSDFAGIDGLSVVSLE
jgi:predicted nucleic acid-binding protein